MEGFTSHERFTSRFNEGFVFQMGGLHFYGGGRVPHGRAFSFNGGLKKIVGWAEHPPPLPPPPWGTLLSFSRKKEREIYDCYLSLCL